MKKILFVILCWQSVAFSQKKSFEEDVLGIEHSSLEKKDKIKEQYESMLKDYKKLKANYKPSDYSQTPTEELLMEVLAYGHVIDPMHLDYPYLIAELKKRPQELEKAIRRKISTPIQTRDSGSFLNRLFTLPKLAGLISNEFQLEVAELALFKKEFSDVSLDDSFFPSEYLLNIIAKSPHDKTSILDRAIKEGRITKGSKFDEKWRGLLKNNADKKENKKNESGNGEQPLKLRHINPEKDEKGKPKEILDRPVIQSESNTNPLNQPQSERSKARQVDEKSSLSWIIGGLIALSLVGVFFIKSRRSS